MLERTTEEVRRLVLSGFDPTSDDGGILSYVEVRGFEAEIHEINERFMEILNDLEESCCKSEPSDDDRRFRLSLALFPIDRMDEGSNERS